MTLQTKHSMYTTSHTPSLPRNCTFLFIILVVILNEQSHYAQHTTYTTNTFNISSPFFFSFHIEEAFYNNK